MSMTFESQRKSDKVFARLDVERPALLHSSTAKLNNNKLGRQDANTRAREGAPLASKSDNDKRLAVQSQRDMVPSAIHIPDWIKQRAEETETVGGGNAQSTILLSEVEPAHTMTQVHESGNQLTTSLWELAKAWLSPVGDGLVVSGYPCDSASICICNWMLFHPQHV